MLTNNPCLHLLRFLLQTINIPVFTFQTFPFPGFWVQRNRIRWVIPNWHNIKDFPWFLPHLKNYLFSPNFSLTITALKKYYPTISCICMSNSFCIFSTTRYKKRQCACMFCFKTVYYIMVIWGPENLQNFMVYQSHLPFTSKVKQQYCPTKYIKV